MNDVRALGAKKNRTLAKEEKTQARAVPLQRGFSDASNRENTYKCPSAYVRQLAARNSDSFSPGLRAPWRTP